MQLKALREAAGYTQEELATIAGLSVHAISALERGERRRPQVETVRALSAALELTEEVRDTLVVAPGRRHSRGRRRTGYRLLPLAPTALIGRESDMQSCGNGLLIPPLGSSRSSGLEAWARPVWR